ncbi:MAG: GGDEF domain-containing protein [Myxococcota bacterium]
MASVEIQPSIRAAVPWLEELPAPTRAALLRRARRFEPGERLIEAGSYPGCIFAVIEGELDVIVCGERVATLGPGELIGELSVIDGAPASAEVTAKSACRLLSLDEQAFWPLVRQSHGFAVALLTKLAGRLRNNNATVVDHAEQRRKFEREATFDALTGLHNRRWLDRTLERLVERAERNHERFSVTLLDVDHFKKFNDSYGHDAGDLVLVLVAEALQAHVRPTDLVARYGGEEMVAVFPLTVAEDARNVAERLRKAIAAVDPVMPCGNRLRSVTASFGVAEWRPGRTAADVLKTADQLLYDAKEAGRNRVHVEAPAEQAA